MDFLLLDSTGNVDIVEIKKPFDNCIMTKSKYRDLSIHISTDATEGVAVVTKKRDKVLLKKKPTDTTNSEYRVGSIIQSDEGAWLLGIV